MEIHWKREKLRQIVLQYATANRITARRMQSMKAAVNFTDLRPVSQGRAHFLSHEYEGFFAIDIEFKGNGKRLICIPKGDFQTNAEGRYIEETITEFEVVEITDYH
jgi:hypothetical protein